MGFAIEGYKYAPESFKAYLVVLDKSGKHEVQRHCLPFTDDQNWDIGYTAICQGRAKAVDKAKRFYRERKTAARRHAYGFGDREDSALFHYIPVLAVSLDAPLDVRLNALKRTRQHLESIGCQIEYGGKAELDGAYRIVKSEKLIYHVDMSRAAVVRLS